MPFSIVISFQGSIFPAPWHEVKRRANVDKVKPLVDSKGWEYEVVLDPNCDFSRAMNVGTMVPYVFIVDGNGKIVYSHQGYVAGGEEELIEKVRELVK